MDAAYGLADEAGNGMDPTGKGRRGWTMRWKAPLNAVQIAFEGRLTPTSHWFGRGQTADRPMTCGSADHGPVSWGE